MVCRVGSPVCDIHGRVSGALDGVSGLVGRGQAQYSSARLACLLGMLVWSTCFSPLLICVKLDGLHMCCPILRLCDRLYKCHCVCTMHASVVRARVVAPSGSQLLGDQLQLDCTCPCIRHLLFASHGLRLCHLLTACCRST